MQRSSDLTAVRAALPGGADCAARIIDIVVKQLGVDRETVDVDSRFIDDLGATSLDHVELVLEIEREFHITISDEDAAKFVTVGRAVHHVEARVETFEGTTREAATTLQVAINLVSSGRHAEALTAARCYLRNNIGSEEALQLVDWIEQAIARSPSHVRPRRSGHEWQVGDVIQDRWRVFGSKAGGMGAVYFVHDAVWRLDMAVKKIPLPPGLDDDKLRRARALFDREVQTWLMLGTQPNIVTGYFALEITGALHFFMQYVPGETLAERIARAPMGRLPIDELLEIAIQIADAMAYPHAMDTVHRDLKPSNCLIEPGGTVRVTDFGLGQIGVPLIVGVDGLGERNVGEGDPAPAVGTPLYMAPEQWRSLDSAGQEADVYALGVMLYEMTVGFPPFGVDALSRQRYRGRVPGTLRQIVEADVLPPEVHNTTLRLFHEHATAIPVTELRADVSEALADLIRNCLAKTARGRPSMLMVRELLVALYEETTGHPPRRATHRYTTLDPQSRSNIALSLWAMGKVREAADMLDRLLASADPPPLYPWLNWLALGLETKELVLDEVLGALGDSIEPAYAVQIRDDPDVALWVERVRAATPEGNPSLPVLLHRPSARTS